MVVGTKEREIVVEYIEPEGGADTSLTNQEGKVEQFPIQEDALPTIDKKSNVTPFRIPAPDEAQQTVQEYRLEAENNRIPPPEAKPLPAKTQEQADQETFFALSQLGGGDNIESDKNQSVTQLINDGKSDIVTKAESQAAVINEEERITVMESFMADPTVNSEAKKKVLTRHSRGGYLPSSLKENYINKLSKPNPNLPSSLRESQNIVQTQMPQRVLTHYDRILDEDVSKRGVRGHIAAFFEGIDHVWDGAELQILGGSKAEYDAGMIEFRKTQEEYRVASALGHMTGIIAPASLALFTGGFIVPIATAAFVAAVIDGDDSLCNTETVKIILDEYEKGEDVVWTGHRWDINGINISGPMPSNVNPYFWPWCSSHLRTFRCSLLSSISNLNFKNTDKNCSIEDMIRH